MNNGLYTAATAMISAERRHEIASENLANLQMQGFKRRILPQASFGTTLDGELARKENQTSQSLGSVPLETVHDFSQGSFKSTSRSLDFALSGEGFFTVTGPEGPLYTRNGSFYVNAERQLVTIDQLPVMGAGGIITIPDGASTEGISLDAEGRLYSGNIEFGQFSIVNFADPTALQSSGATLYAAPQTMSAEPSTATVLQGSLEQANVETITELVSIIASSRQFEAAQKSMTMLSEVLQKRIGLR